MNISKSHNPFIRQPPNLIQEQLSLPLFLLFAIILTFLRYSLPKEKL